MSSLSSSSPAPSNQFWSMQIDLYSLRVVQWPHAYVFIINDIPVHSHASSEVVMNYVRKEWGADILAHRPKTVDITLTPQTSVKPPLEQQKSA